MQVEKVLGDVGDRIEPKLRSVYNMTPHAQDYGEEGPQHDRKTTYLGPVVLKIYNLLVSRLLSFMLEFTLKLLFSFRV